jgi:hypothetical protein
MDSDEDNYRLFFYCPTRDNQISWSCKQAKVNVHQHITETALKLKLDGVFFFCVSFLSVFLFFFNLRTHQTLTVTQKKPILAKT